MEETKLHQEEFQQLPGAALWYAKHLCYRLSNAIIAGTTSVFNKPE
jgi:hypothetical protein